MGKKTKNKTQLSLQQLATDAGRSGLSVDATVNRGRPSSRQNRREENLRVNQASKEFCQLSGRQSQPSEGSNSFLNLQHFSDARLPRGQTRTRGYSLTLNRLLFYFSVTYLLLCRVFLEHPSLRFYLLLTKKEITIDGAGYRVRVRASTRVCVCLYSGLTVVLAGEIIHVFIFFPPPPCFSPSAEYHHSGKRRL